MSDDLVTVITARDADEARVIQAVLRSAGIPAMTEGDSLMDEWAVSQRALGRIGSAVKVPPSFLEQARAVLEEALRLEGVFPDSSASPDPELALDTEQEEEERRLAEDARSRAWPTSAVIWLCALFALAALFAGLWVDTRIDLQRATTDPIFEYVWDESGTRLDSNLRKSGRTIVRLHDGNRDRVFERTESLNPAGEPTWEAFDHDGDGIYERTVLHSPPPGSVILEILDRNGDTFPEAVVITTADGSRRTFEDTDGNFSFSESQRRP